MLDSEITCLHQTVYLLNAGCYTAPAKVRDLNNVQIYHSCRHIMMKICPPEGKFYAEQF